MAITPEQLSTQLETFCLQMPYAASILLLLQDAPADDVDIMAYIMSVEGDNVDFRGLLSDIGSLMSSSLISYDVRREEGVYRLTKKGEELARAITDLADTEIKMDLSTEMYLH
jgi:predicted transcriptional regulator